MPGKLPFWKFFYEIEIPESLKKRANFWIDDKVDTEKISELKKINIFVGPNNSGKSYILREVLKSEPKEFFPTELFSDFGLLNIKLKSELRRRDTQFGFKTLEIITDHENTKLSKNIYLNSCINFFDNEIYYNHYNSSGDIESYGKFLADIKGEFLNLGLDAHYSIKKSKLVYIPTIRTLRLYNERKITQMENFYSEVKDNNFNQLDLVRKAAVIDNNESVKKLLTAKTQTEYGLDNIVIQNGQDLYSKIYEFRNSSNDNLRKFIQFQDFLSTNFFGGKKISIISNTYDHNITFEIEGEKERAIHELGDGIQQIIILTFPLFFYDSGFIVIEEPEMNIHPGLQKQLIEIYNKSGYCDEKGNDYSDNFMFFIATHSNHILDTTLEYENTSIYRVEKELASGANTPNFNIHYQKHNSSILDCLGVSASSVFLANGIIWVEGPSDAIYIEHWLNLFITKEGKPILTKGLHYTFQYLNLFTLNTVGYDNFWEYAQNKPKDVISLADLNHNSIFVTDNDGAFDLSAKNFSNAKILDVDQVKTKQNTKFTFIEKILSKKNLIPENIIDAGGVHEDKLLYWVNLHTVESYLDHFLKIHGNIAHKFETWTRIKPTTFTECFDHTNHKPKSFIIVKDNRASKVELSREITKTFTNFDDFFAENGDLYEKIKALYNTIASWNKSGL